MPRPYLAAASVCSGRAARSARPARCSQTVLAPASTPGSPGRAREHGVARRRARTARSPKLVTTSQPPGGGTAARRRGRCRSTRAASARLQPRRAARARAGTATASTRDRPPAPRRRARRTTPAAAGARRRRRSRTTSPVARPRQRHPASVAAHVDPGAAEERRILTVGVVESRRPRAGRAPRPGRGTPSRAARARTGPRRARGACPPRGRAPACVPPESSHSLPCLRVGLPVASRSGCGRPYRVACRTTSWFESTQVVDEPDSAASARLSATMSPELRGVEVRLEQVEVERLTEALGARVQRARASARPTPRRRPCAAGRTR